MAGNSNLHASRADKSNEFYTQLSLVENELKHYKKNFEDKTIHGQKWRRMGNIYFFTNLDIKKRHEDMVLFRNYTPEAYPKYDNYDAIELSKTVDIPCDYFGIMGVPITFMDKYNPEQFEILGGSRYHDGQDFSDDINILNSKTLYRRIVIRRINKGE